jgi:hypothetical protein
LECSKLADVRKFPLGEVQKLTLIDTAMNTGKLVVYSKVVFGKLSERSETEHGLVTIYLLDHIVVGILGQPQWLRPKAIV